MNTVMAAKPRIRVPAGSRQVSAAAPRAAHNAADRSMQTMAGWAPPLWSADAEWLWERDISIARIRDLSRNEGWMQAAIDRTVDMALGANFRPSAKPDAKALGISQEAADELGHQIETGWRSYANDPIFRNDAQRMQPIPLQFGLMGREVVQAGEALGVVRWIQRRGWPWGTALEVIDADRLSNPHGRVDDDTLRGGVELDDNGAPVAYHVRRSHPNDVGWRSSLLEWTRIPRFDAIEGWERPKVLHCFEMRRPGQHRGVSRLVAALSKMRMLSRYSEAEVRAAAINGSIVGAIYTQLGNEYAAEVLGNDIATPTSSRLKEVAEARADFYGERRVLDDARFLTLFPTDRLDLNTQPRQTAGFPAFQTAFLQNFAASLGISYEQLSMDWSRTNYSSARAALNEVWRSILRLRAVIVAGCCQPFWLAWLEEAFDNGTVTAPAGAPDFYDAPAAYARAIWIGPPRGYVDPVKEAQASAIRIQARLSTLEREAAELGGEDLDELLHQLAEEMRMLAKYGLSGPAADKVTAESDAEADRRLNARPGE